MQSIWHDSLDLCTQIWIQCFDCRQRLQVGRADIIAACWALQNLELLQRSHAACVTTSMMCHHHDLPDSVESLVQGASVLVCRHEIGREVCSAPQTGLWV